METFVPDRNTMLEKNRYANVLCGCDTRVTLSGSSTDPMSTYINANYMHSDLEGAEQKYITTQAPLVTTAGDFWRMNWENKTNLVIMLTNFVEKGREKADPYWKDGSMLELENNMSVLTEVEETIG